MAFKVTFIGAGSIGFTRGLLRDLLSVPEFRNMEVSFTDINQDNLAMVTQLCQRDINENGLKITIHSTTNRREALLGAKYIFNVVRIGGLSAFQKDIEIPLKYGIDQCVGDTLSAGGIMYGQRGIAEMLEICKDIKEVAEEDCLLLNYANPMAMITWACNKYGGIRTIGLCHGVQGGHRQIANVLGIDKNDLDIICAGINHQTWYIKVSYKGQDQTSKLLTAFENHPEYSQTEKVRIDMLRRFGYYSTESNGHLSEYVPWYRKRPEEIREWIDLGSWINGETGGYLRVCTEGRTWFKTDFPNWLKDPALEYKQENRSEEHGSYILEGLETGRVYRGHFNMVNNGVISNLPDDAIIEAPGYVDRNGINMPLVGELPLGCAAVCNVSISVQRLAVEAAVSGDDQLLRQAMMMDPLIGAVCNPKEIWQMVDELLVAQEEWLSQYSEAIAEAKIRLKSGNLLPTKEYRGAARLKVKTIEEMEKDREAANKNAGEADKAKERPVSKQIKEL
ncbi:MULTISPECIES: alpha-glucosidase/alpha-galactosidase [Niallia]|jgi:alpha-galactosidase|uniref:alpha-glucosidase/alpha-galactosidase n=1 Tax=Niallia TaxID=2837506 RepID=UPI0003196C7B|nr:alpha-glucosidase/alpha-galactosidase [Niallia circulans]AYV67735.1 alpha-glucosidase/alpha-galactosidase [Niallia circulans]AYV73915.1 alpha-glucosidase/alpha-galactosidase [Niallia circulans]NRG29256.1 alpha-glucosidase/alpha-galactosidase [Niallia circulans]QJX63658.1 alpha-glucosidase/alpha-galactosidase [Niallia circulans]